jgi:hypothetical protein
MSQLGSYPQLKRVLPTSVDFARFQLKTNLLESVCLNCFEVLGTSSHPAGLRSLEQSHQCTKPGTGRGKAAA